MPRATFAFTLLVFMIVTGVAMAQNLGAMSCDELWFERNSVYKQAGFCFKTPRAIREFGNAGCLYDDLATVPLSQRDQAAIRNVQVWERRQNCPR